MYSFSYVDIQPQFEGYYKTYQMKISTGVMLLLAACLLGLAQSQILSTVYCGFSGAYCGQSYSDDINSRSNIVTLAYALVGSDGNVMYDGNNINKTMIASWRQTGKFVLLSVGGPNNLWNNAFSSESNRQNFVNSLANLVNISDFDGVDLDIEAYFTTSPRNVANTIKDLRVLFNKFKGKRWITLTADCIGVYQGAPVPSPDDTKIQAFNFVVPIIQLADDAIDYYNSKAYSNWYDGYNHTAVEYIQDIYLNWRNLPGMCQGCRPIPNFKGVDGAKILIGLLASPDARTAAEYGGPNLVKNTKAWLLKQGYKVAGFQLWNSYFDKANGYQVSTTIIGG